MTDDIARTRRCERSEQTFNDTEPGCRIESMLLRIRAEAVFAALLFGATVDCHKCVECGFSDELATCERCSIDGSGSFCKRPTDLVNTSDSRCEYKVVARSSSLEITVDLSTEPGNDELIIETRVEGSLDGVNPTIDGRAISSCSPRPPSRILCYPLPPAPFTMVLRNTERDIEKVSVKSRLHSCGDTIRTCPL